MFHSHEPFNSVKNLDGLLSHREQMEIVRAANFAFAGKHSAAEHIRERLGYSRQDLRTDIDKCGA